MASTGSEIADAKRSYREAQRRIRSLETRLAREKLSPDGARAEWLRAQLERERRALVQSQARAFAMVGRP